MDEIMLKEYMDNKSKGMDDYTFMEKMKHILNNQYNRGISYSSSKDMDWNYNRGMSGYMNRHSDSKLMSILDELTYEDKQKLAHLLGNESIHRSNYDYDESNAKHIVNSMYHYSNDKKYTGEKFDMNKAKEVYEKYHSSFTSPASVEDVYLAINAQYHDYCDLYKKWFGVNIDSKIIESAVTFWFKDVDYHGINKVQDYFMNI